MGFDASDEWKSREKQYNEPLLEYDIVRQAEIAELLHERVRTDIFMNQTQLVDYTATGRQTFPLPSPLKLLQHSRLTVASYNSDGTVTVRARCVLPGRGLSLPDGRRWFPEREREVQFRFRLFVQMGRAPQRVSRHMVDDDVPGFVDEGGRFARGMVNAVKMTVGATCILFAAKYLWTLGTPNVAEDKPNEPVATAPYDAPPPYPRSAEEILRHLPNHQGLPLICRGGSGHPQH